ncbi:MAG: hypothetical protein V3T84_16750 [Phycisphaerales bacterium]
MKREDLEQLAERIHREEGDAIAGERVIGQARRINKIHVVPGTSRHRGMETVLKSNALCVIDKSFRLAGEPFHLKSE